MCNAENGLSSIFVEFQMLVYTHGGLDEDKCGDDDKADDHVVAVEFVDALAQYDAEGHADDKKDDAYCLEWSVDESNFLGGWKIEGE